MNGILRLPQGGEIDRAKALDFTFDGRAFTGFAGDTVASALLAGGVLVVGRSFKYHRPRGIVSAGIEEPNAILDLRHGSRHDPNLRATMEPLASGMQFRSIHALGTAASDRLGFVDRLHRFIPAAFYYKTFLWPNWHFYEKAIRRLAGLGRLDLEARTAAARHRHANVDLCVIGAGPAGLAAALAGIHAGKQVLLVDEQTRPGGSLLHRQAEINGKPALTWVDEVVRELISSGAIILSRSIAFGLYDHNEIAIVEAGRGNREILWRARARKLVIAAGAIERPLLFEDNDKPGIMLAGAGLSYLRRHALRLGSRVVIATNNDSPYELAMALRQAGTEVSLVDERGASALGQAAIASGVAVHFGARIRAALGRGRASAVRLESGETLDAEFLFVSGGWTPSIHLYCQARAKPRWDGAIGAFIPGEAVEGIEVAGAACGTWDLSRALADGHRAGGGAEAKAPNAASGHLQWSNGVTVPANAGSRRIWVDLQADVTVGDVELAARENFASVEHLKRYTTLGMANDQGKTSNLNGLAVLSQATAREMPALGLTTFRPPYAPVSMATIAGRNRGQLYAPVRRLPGEIAHRQDAACLREYGGILRPAWYGTDGSAIAAECLAARQETAIFDASSLGKIEVIGPDAARFLDFICYSRMSTLVPGRMRYTLMLTEGGVIFDDGVVLRLSEESFVVSCSSSHVAAIGAHLEEWRQDRFERARVFIHDATSHWATLAIVGPGSRALVTTLGLGIAVDDAALPHMAMRSGEFQGKAARVARVSFTGERSYEVSVPASFAARLWHKARELGARPIGVEALSILRAEKGYVIVGQDTDGETMPHDIGMPGPRDKREDAYVGDRSLFTPAAKREGRRQLVGILADGGGSIPAGAHAIDPAREHQRGLGYVTSSFRSPSLGHGIALGLIENGRARIGQSVVFEHLGRRLSGRVVAPCFMDPEGRRLHV